MTAAPPHTAAKCAGATSLGEKPIARITPSATPQLVP